MFKYFWTEKSSFVYMSYFLVKQTAEQTSSWLYLKSFHSVHFEREKERRRRQTTERVHGIKRNRPSQVEREVSTLINEAQRAFLSLWSLEGNTARAYSRPSSLPLPTTGAEHSREQHWFVSETGRLTSLIAVPVGARAIAGPPNQEPATPWGGY